MYDRLTLMIYFLNYRSFRNGYNVTKCLIMLTEKCACSTGNSLSSVFLCIFKVWSMLSITIQWGLVQKKECYFMLKYTFSTFFCYCFSSKNSCFNHFHFLFWWSIKFLQQNINQSETRIGDTKLSLELWKWWKALDGSIGNIWNWIHLRCSGDSQFYYPFPVYVFLDTLWF